VDAPVSGSAAVLGSPLSKAAVAAQPCANVGDVSCDSKWSGEVRPDTSYSIASSLAVDFEFPVPPQRMKEQLSDDGTLLSRAGLQLVSLKSIRCSVFTINVSICFGMKNL